MSQAKPIAAIQRGIIDDAIRRLRSVSSSGVQFAVLLPTGETFGDLQIKPPKKPKPEPKFHHVYTWGHLQVGEKLRAAPVGDGVLFFPFEPNATRDYLKKMQTRIAGEANKVLGAGVCKTMLNHDLHQIELNYVKDSGAPALTVVRKAAA